jgi:uridine phosphorylase
MENTTPILEFDPAQDAILNPPKATNSTRLPEKGVLCFFAEILAELLLNGVIKEVGSLLSEIGRNPIYELVYEGQRMFVLHPGVGAPLAAAFMDEAIALGAQAFIACGGCGVLRHDIVAGHPVILTSAVRDEGTSYHYLPPSREVSASPEATAALEVVMKTNNIPYLLGKSWTTDAIYRETEAKRDLRMREGCEVVEMEASAFFAVAKFRGVTFGQVVYGGDLVVPEGWDQREWHLRINDRQRLFWLAVKACALLKTSSKE